MFYHNLRELDSEVGHVIGSHMKSALRTAGISNVKSVLNSPRYIFIPEAGLDSILGRGQNEQFW